MAIKNMTQTSKHVWIWYKMGEQMPIKRKKEYTHHLDPTLKASRMVKYCYMLILIVVVKRKCVCHIWAIYVYKLHLGPESSTQQ
jgi:hypothetical protein